MHQRQVEFPVQSNQKMSLIKKNWVPYGCECRSDNQKKDFFFLTRLGGGSGRKHKSQARLPVGVLFPLAQDAQDVQEEVEDVQVEVDGRQDVFLRRQLVQHHLRVHDDEEGEKHSAPYGDPSLHQLPGEKHLSITQQRLGQRHQQNVRH